MLANIYRQESKYKRSKEDHSENDEPLTGQFDAAKIKSRDVIADISRDKFKFKTNFDGREMLNQSKYRIYDQPQHTEI